MRWLSKAESDASIPISGAASRTANAGTGGDHGDVTRGAVRA